MENRIYIVRKDGDSFELQDNVDGEPADIIVISGYLWGGGFYTYDMDDEEIISFNGQPPNLVFQGVTTSDGYTNLVFENIPLESL